MASKVADSKTAFCLVGRFLAFLPGEKSPYQMISLDVSPETESEAGPKAFSVEDSATCYQITLGKQLRQMMYRYLEPQDWVRVVGCERINLRSGQMEWKAAEILKLSNQQVAAYRAAAESQSAISLAKKSEEVAAKPVRVLICQKSDCQQRGSEAVSQALKAAILQRSGSAGAQADGVKEVIVQSMGCMKRCKEGPNVVMVPGGAHCGVTVEGARSLIETLL